MIPEIHEIYTFKLLTGEEIVARIVSGSAEDGYKIEHPILCALTPQGLQMMPGLFSSNQDKTVLLNKSSWAMIAETREDIRNSWIQATTGIAPVSKQIITG
jgi:N-methylhydantoinase A/oxoprolinase/acetone carboxylase beta subunit